MSGTLGAVVIGVFDFWYDLMDSWSGVLAMFVKFIAAL
jgi:hypothetical protein